MLRAEELRLKNWIARGGNGEYYQATAETISDLENGHIKPTGIPLTEEWLEKFGFKITDGHNNIRLYAREQEDNVNFVLTDYRKPKLEGIRFNAHYVFEYVHQLQNLYFALTSKELTIKVEP